MTTEAQVEPEGLADELEQLLAKRADRSIPGARVHDRLTHFVEANKVVILAALRSSTVNDELVEALREMVESCGITPSIHDGCGTMIITAPSAATFAKARAALAKIGIAEHQPYHSLVGIARATLAKIGGENNGR